MIFYQLFEHESSTYTYLLACESTKNAILIDPVLETVDRDLKLIGELGLTLMSTIETHVHADHVTGAFKLREKTGSKIIISGHANAQCADIKVFEGDKICFGKYELLVLETTGHTDSCLSFVLDDMIFTGDLLFIRGTGRTDFQHGDSKKMFKSIREKIFTYPDKTKIFPGHDYKGIPYSTVGDEKKYNPRVGLSKNEDDFIQIMKNLKLDEPKKIKIALPANKKCGNI